MICYQYRTSGECEPLTPDVFARLIISDEVVNRIKSVRKLREQGNFKMANLQKTLLPLLCFHASEFDVTEAPEDSRDGRRKKGQMGRWRLQKSVRLSGLVMLDIDHMENEEFRMKSEEFASADFKQKAKELGIVLVHVTSSGQGLRIVAKADPEVGNLADNQRALAAKLNVICDDAVKDASRGSFCPGFEDIIYINKEELFSYENKEYDEKFREEYRGGNSTATRSSNNNVVGSGSRGNTGVAPNSTQTVQGNSENSGLGTGCDAGSVLTKTYGGVTYEHIIDCWMDEEVPGWRERAGKEDDPTANRRHKLLLKLASDLRHVCDSQQVLKQIVQECRLGVSMRESGDGAEVDRLANDCLSYKLHLNAPKRLRAILERAGVREPQPADRRTTLQAGIDYESWWRRLQPLLDESPYLREACSLLPPHHRIGGVLASGAMFGTYLSRCWWEHFDGKPLRLSFLVYIIGHAASGKSVIGDIDKLIMAPMKAADNAGREWERQFKEEMKKRASSSKNAKEAAPEQQHPVIRYVPSTISNAQLYTRLTDAVDKDCQDAWGEPLHLHLYTYEAELATALRAQSGGAWAAKLDLECKSFQNEEAGVDYKNEGSTNGIIQVNWNQVVTGTPDAMRRKIRKSTVLDGLVTRLSLFPMPSNDNQMIKRGMRIIQHDRDCMLRAVGLDLEKISGELHCERLVDFAYEYESELCEQANANDDNCLHYFRKRIPIIMIRYALVRAVLRQVKELQRGEELVIEDSDLEFARLIGDFCLDMQIHMFGNDVMEALEQQDSAFTPRRRSNKVKDRFEKLPEEFTRDMLVANCLDLKPAAVSATLKRWLDDGLIERRNGKYVKKTNSVE